MQELIEALRAENQEFRGLLAESMEAAKALRLLLKQLGRPGGGCLEDLIERGQAALKRAKT